MPKHYSFRPRDRGFDARDVERLIGLARDLPVEERGRPRHGRDAPRRPGPAARALLEGHSTIDHTGVRPEDLPFE